MRLARLPSTIAIALAAAAMLVACARQDEPSPAPSTGVSRSTGEARPTGEASSAGEASVPGLATAPPATAASHDGAEACGGDACGADACSGDACGAGPVDQPVQAAALRRVASDQVCMRTNRFLGKPQRVAEVEGRTYFGCCAGCTKQLGANAAVRTAKDPVTGQPVDKASAVIAARPDGTVVYFASEETFARAGGA